MLHLQSTCLRGHPLGSKTKAAASPAVAKETGPHSAVMPAVGQKRGRGRPKGSETKLKQQLVLHQPQLARSKERDGLLGAESRQSSPAVSWKT